MIGGEGKIFSNESQKKVSYLTNTIKTLGREAPNWTGDENLPFMQYAKTFRAYVFDIEHRFFGDSRPIKLVSQ